MNRRKILKIETLKGNRLDNTNKNVMRLLVGETISKVVVKPGTWGSKHVFLYTTSGLRFHITNNDDVEFEGLFECE